MTGHYERLAALMSKVRNARATTLVGYLEEVIENDLWRDFTTPAGTRFQFRSHEFDYFLAAQEHDAAEIRRHYAAAELPDMARRQMRLADITGRGEAPPDEARRPARDVAELYASDPSGAGARIRHRHAEKNAPVTRSTSEIAKDPERRAAYLAGEKIARQQVWTFRVRTVEDADVGTRAKRIVAELGKDPELEAAVRRALHANYIRNYRDDQKAQVKPCF